MQAVGKVIVGKSGLAVTRLCFGLAPLGSMPDTYGHSVEAETARQPFAPSSIARSTSSIRRATMASDAARNELAR
jgi:hypothetical protein